MAEGPLTKKAPKTGPFTVTLTFDFIDTNATPFKQYHAGVPETVDEITPYLQLQIDAGLGTLS